MSGDVSESERQQIAEISRLSEAVRIIANAYEKQNEKLDRIADTSARNSAQLDALNKKADTSASKVDDLATKLGECPCPAVSDLETRTRSLEDAGNIQKGRFSMLDILLTAGASAGGGGGITMLIIKLFGGI